MRLTDSPVLSPPSDIHFPLLPIQSTTTTTKMPKRLALDQNLQTEIIREDHREYQRQINQLHNKDTIAENGTVNDNGQVGVTRRDDRIVWRNVFLLGLVHLIGSYGLYLYLFQCHFLTLMFTDFTILMFGFGVTCGAHRLWSHKSYDATLPLRIFLMICNSAMLQNDIYEWSRDHRVHHKYSETDADPHNANRGFFFAHMGWLLLRKHPEVSRKGCSVDMSDLARDPVVRFQRNYYKPLALFCTFVVPTLIPYYCWNEDLVMSFAVSMFRYALSLHITWLVNSAAHLWGEKHYDTNLNPSENNLVRICSVGEGYHNYHHIFPYDYSASELSWRDDLNLSTWFIDCCVSLGLASNPKKVDSKIVRNRIERTGDKSLNEAYIQARRDTGRNTTYLGLWVIVVLIPSGIYLSRIVLWLTFRVFSALVF